MNAVVKSMFLAIGLFLALTASVSAAPGDLDPSFGIGGKLTNWAGGANAVVIQPDGKIVAVGRTPFNVFAVARYNADGSPDAAFGNAGRISFPVGFFGSSFGIDAAIQPDGKIIVTCYDDDQGFGAIVRLNVNGSLDTSFGNNGTVDTTGGAYSVAIQPDGKIITSGGVPFNNPFNHRIRRYNTNGSIDTTFGSGGVTDLQIGAIDVLLQSDGKIVAAGQASNTLAVARLNPDGTADQSFGFGGLATAPIGSDALGVSVSVQRDGKIVAVGYRWTGPGAADHSLVRYNANGKLDTTFDNDGIVALTGGLGYSYFNYRVVADPNDGKIVVSGLRLNGSNNDFAIGRYNSNGSLDSTFGGGDGITTVDFNNSDDIASAVALDSQGRAVLVGQSDEAFALARFLLKSNPPFDYDGDGRSDISVFRPSDRIWYLNQSTNGFSAMEFGLSTDKLTPADYDGDGRTDISVYRDGTWYWLNSSTGSFQSRRFGIASDVPVPADYYTGGGRSELAVYRNGTWWILNLANNQINTIQFGLATDKPVVGDYDGDGRTDQAVYRGGEWHINRSSNDYTVIQFGLPNDNPVPSDYDGDGKTDLAVYRDGTWYVLQSSQGFMAFQWGIATDIPAPADYDGDGRTDAAVYRNGTWYLRQTTSGISIQQFGLGGDKPVLVAFLP